VSEKHGLAALQTLEFGRKSDEELPAYDVIAEGLPTNSREPSICA
jgi:hypothetical protein